METKKEISGPEHTALRVALWRALHVLIDSKPYVFVDEWGAKLAEEAHWQDRADMDPEFSKSMRASIVGRARFIEDLLDNEIKKGVTQYVILGAGLDTFAQRRSDTASRLNVFEVDQVGLQNWKKKRLKEIGWDIPKWIHFVPVDFETGQSWWEQLILSGFDTQKPAVIVSTGVCMYLSKEANLTMLKQISRLAPGSTFTMTFMLALNLLSAEERGILEFVMKKASESKTPFLSLFSPNELLQMANEAGFVSSQYISGEEIYQLYFANRSDGLRAGDAEAFLIART